MILISIYIIAVFIYILKDLTYIIIFKKYWIILDREQREDFHHSHLHLTVWHQPTYWLHPLLLKISHST